MNVCGAEGGVLHHRGGECSKICGSFPDDSPDDVDHDRPPFMYQGLHSWGCLASLMRTLLKFWCWRVEVATPRCEYKYVLAFTVIHFSVLIVNLKMVNPSSQSMLNASCTTQRYPRGVFVAPSHASADKEGRLEKKIHTCLPFWKRRQSEKPIFSLIFSVQLHR